MQCVRCSCLHAGEITSRLPGGAARGAAVPAQPAAWYRFSAGHGLVLILGDAQAGGLHRRGLGIGMEIGSYTFAIHMTLNSSCLLLDVRYLLSTSCSCII